MMKASNIVCVFDLSASSEKALPMAAKLAGDMGARLMLLYPVSNARWSIYSVMTYSPQREAAEAMLEAEPFIREIMSRSPEVEWELKVEAGNPDDVIESWVRAVGADLVISTRHRGRVEILESFQLKEATVGRPEMPALGFSLPPAAIVAEVRQVALPSI